MAKEAGGKASMETLGGISPVYGAGEAGGQGMMRITRGDQVRWIWPVHLPGWLAVGWRVSPLAADLPGSVRTALAAAGAAAEPSAAADVVAEVAAEEAKPAVEVPQATTKQKGRSRRKASAAVEPAPATPEPAAAPAEPVEPVEPVIEATPEAVADDLLIDVLAD